MPDAPSRGPPGAREFLVDTERRLYDLSVDASRADWVYLTFVTDDTEQLSADATRRAIEATVDAAKRSTVYDPTGLTDSDRRRLGLLRLSLSLATPSDPAAAAEVTTIVARMTGTYGKGRYTPHGQSTPLDVQGLSRLLVTSREPRVLEDAWEGWHRVGLGIRRDFERFVALSNQGARELGFDDTGAMWRSKYDMSATAFSSEVERLFDQVRPLFRSLHAYVRRRLVETYGADVVPPRGPIPAHLTGNMWAQGWENILPLVVPPDSPSPFDLTGALVAKGMDGKEMVRYAERFFVSLGLDPLPPTFWERSMFAKPVDRDVVCHASAHDIDFVRDVRIKMCIDVTGEDFRVVHHELGHNYYQLACAPLPFLFRDGAHDGFHEAIGDTIALSVTPEYLRKIGLFDGATDDAADRALLLGMALEKIAFLPSGYAFDAWRWKVFSGEISPDRYTTSWWDLRRTTQGIAPPGDRTDAMFDPGAKFHIPANVPYIRYFLAAILQFQFHRALAREIGWDGPLHRASIFGSPAAGRRLGEMLKLGASRPWPDALEAITGERRMDASALLEYFEPLRAWLHAETAGDPVGW